MKETREYVDIPNITHVFQRAEENRTGFVEKVLAFFEEPQWAVVGDTFVVGCEWSENIVYRNSSFEDNKDGKDQKYNSKYGVYEPNCRLDNLRLFWGHDESLYRVLVHNKSSLPEEALKIIRYHSFYPWHSSGDYQHLMKDEDEQTKKWIQILNKYDLYSKSAEVPDIEKLWPYYESMIDKYIPGVLKW